MASSGTVRGGAERGGRAARATGAGISRRWSCLELREGRSANSGPLRRHPVYGPAACAPTASGAATARPQESSRVVARVHPWSALAGVGVGRLLGFGTVWGRAPGTPNRSLPERSVMEGPWVKGMGRDDCRSYPKGPDSSKLGLVFVTPQLLAPLPRERTPPLPQKQYPSGDTPRLLGCVFMKGVL